MRWVKSPVDIGMITGLLPHGHEIHLYKPINELGWKIDFDGLAYNQTCGSLLAAQIAGIGIARMVLTDCLLSLEDRGLEDEPTVEHFPNWPPRHPQSQTR